MRTPRPEGAKEGRLPQSFYARDVRTVARELVGKHLLHRGRGGRIVETEAYLGPQDRASHARFGPLGRSKPLFGPPGVVYVFLIYGMHECFNIVADHDGAASAVLIRALEPDPGVGRCDGPGRLTKALGIGRDLNGVTLYRPDDLVSVEDRVKHALYGKVLRRNSKLKAHDEQNDCGVGDRVLIMETRPLSATKRWRVVEILEKAK